MFDKLTKMQLAQCGGFFLASYIGAALGTIWILQPWMDGTAASFAYAPGITFSMAACLAWAKALDQVICKPLCSDNASLLMTLPVSEEDFVDSRILLGAGGSTLFYLCIGMGVLCMTGLQDGLEFTFTSLSAMFIDLSYGPWTGAISFGLIPVIVFLVQVLTSMILLMIVLKCRKHIILQKIVWGICFVILLLQVLGNILIITNYKEMITAIHPLILEGGIALVLILGVVFLRKQAIHVLKYRYND